MSEQQQQQSSQNSQQQDNQIVDPSNNNDSFDADLLDDVLDQEVQEQQIIENKLREEEDILFRVRDPDEEIKFYHGNEDEFDDQVQQQDNNNNNNNNNITQLANEKSQSQTIDKTHKQIQEDQINFSSIQKLENINEEQEQELNLDEDLELLCNQVEADQAKQQRLKEIKKMNKKMDEKLDKIRAEKLKVKQTQVIQEQQHMKEKYTGLICKHRVLKDDDVDIYISGREFIPIETLDLTVQDRSSHEKPQNLKEQQQQPKPQPQIVRSFFTIGVVIDVSGPFQSKNNKRYTITRISDLQKYDMTKVKRVLQQQLGNDQNLIKAAEKSFNSNGYKILKLMSFEDALVETTKIQSGTIVGIVNPKPMKPNPEYGFSFCMDAAASIFKIGYSEDLQFCKGQGNMTTSGFFNNAGVSTCKHFLNKSIESMCDTHKFMKQQTTMNKIKAHRNTMQSEFIDLNQVRKQMQQEEQEKRIGAFGANGMRKFKSNQNNKIQRAQLSPNSQRKLQLQQEYEKKLYDSFLKDRTSRAEVKKASSFLTNIKCNETAHLGKACIPGAQQNNQNKKLPQLDLSTNKNTTNLKAKFELKNNSKDSDDDLCGLEFTDQKENKSGINNQFSLRSLINQQPNKNSDTQQINKKTTFDHKFGDDNKGQSLGLTSGQIGSKRFHHNPQNKV